MRANDLFPALSTIQSSQARIAPAFLALLIYAFIAGPVPYWILKPRKKGLLVWIIIPISAIGFTLVAPLYSLVLEDTASAFFGVTLIEARESTSLAIKTSDLLVFSGGREQHDVTIRRPYAQAYTALPDQRKRSGDAVIVDQAFVDLDEQRYLRLQPLRLAMWGSRYLSVESVTENPLGLKGQVSLTADRKVRLQLRNGGQYKLFDLYVVFPLIEQGGRKIAHMKVDELAREASIDVTENYSVDDLSRDKTELYELVVARILASRYSANITGQLTAWVFARLDVTAGPDDILTDESLLMNSWTSIGVAPLSMSFAREVPLGVAVTEASERKVGEKDENQRKYEELERSVRLLLPEPLMPKGVPVTGLKLRVLCNQPFKSLRLELRDRSTGAWIPIDESVARVVEPELIDKRSFVDLQVVEPEKFLNTDERCVELRASYWRALVSRRTEIRVDCEVQLAP